MESREMVCEVMNCTEIIPDNIQSRTFVATVMSLQSRNNTEYLQQMSEYLSIPQARLTDLPRNSDLFLKTLIYYKFTFWNNRDQKYRHLYIGFPLRCKSLHKATWLRQERHPCFVFWSQSIGSMEHTEFCFKLL